jgi:anaerobic magnesium-protoporphyrin IX monomethyl ester cyclase
MRILILNPSLRPGSETKYFPVGVASIMTYLKSRGWSYDFLDIDIDDMSDADVEAYIAHHEYDVFMAGSIVTHYKWMKWLTHTIRKYHPSSKIIIGNSVAGSIPEAFLKNSSADIAIIGEGEVTTDAVLVALKSHESLVDVEGIAYLDSAGELVKTPKRKAMKKIDDFPLIDWSDLNKEKYFAKSYAGAEGLVFEDGFVPKVMPVVTARGCAFKCTFCHYVFWDDPYRYRSPTSIVAEIRRNIEVYGVNYINFWDDLSFASLNQAERLADEIIGSGLKFNWNAAVRVDLFGNPKHPYERRKHVAEKFLRAGCLNLGFSLESGNQEILNMMNKHVEKEYFFEQVKILKEVGITCSTSVVFGYPIETKETIEETFDQCLMVGVYPSIGYLLPLPATGMYVHAKVNGYIVDDDAYLDSITERQDLCINMTEMTSEDIMGHIKKGARELNEMLKLGLSGDKLIKTGGYRAHSKATSKNAKPLIDVENMKRNQNDVSFNYSQVRFYNNNLKK